eukprot:TRINITY_DN52426_c0_g1_i1.p1 TRINITY_DN52426_c0_g1~~TRINITY_DN52426_c0_g1_i1.p1  ORF type:complete len:401 (-),score=54.36 TRINITY_DN52426_c0_g1_i1:23-1225(-)
MRLSLSAFVLDDPTESVAFRGDLDGCSHYSGSISLSPAGFPFVRRGACSGASFTASSFLDGSFVRRHHLKHYAGHHYPMSPKLQPHSHSHWRHAGHHDHHRHEGQTHGHAQHFPMKRHLRHPLHKHRQLHGHFQHRLPSNRVRHSLHIPHHPLAMAGFIENASGQAGVDMPPHQQERHAKSSEPASFAMDESCIQRKAELKRQIFLMSSKIAASIPQQKQLAKAVNSLQDLPDTNDMAKNQKRRVEIDKLLEEQAKALQKENGLRKEKLDLINELRKLKCEVAELPPEETGTPFECPPCDPLPEPRQREPMVSAEDDPQWTHANQVVAPVNAQQQKPPLIGEPSGLANSFPDYDSHQDSITPQEQVIPWIVTSLLPLVRSNRSSDRMSQERRLAIASCFL